MKDPLERTNPDVEELKAQHAAPIVAHQEEVRRLSEETRVAAAEAADKAGEEQRRKEAYNSEVNKANKYNEKDEETRKAQEKAEAWREHDKQMQDDALLNKQFALDDGDGDAESETGSR